MDLTLGLTLLPAMQNILNFLPIAVLRYHR